MTGTALVVSHTLFARDPRVAREVRWLQADGWTVDTVGLGAAALPGVRRHWEYRTESPLLRTVVAKAAVHALLPPAARARPLLESRLDGSLLQTLASDPYDLVLVNDIALLPLIRHLPPSSRRVHVDLHEYHRPDLADSMRGARLANPFHRWARSLVGDPRVRSRSTVARGIAELYRDELGVAEPRVIRNCPPYEDLEPSPVDPGAVELVYHGIPSWERGLRPLLEAMDLLPDRFRLTLILVGTPPEIDAVRRAVGSTAGDRVAVRPPVPVREIARRINEYDLEVMFYPPASENLRFALPNKLFEAVQARLGVVVGRSPMMTEIVERYGNGAIVDGWDARDLADRLAGLSAAEIARMKQGSARAAQDLNEEHEHAVFREVVAAFRPSS